MSVSGPPPPPPPPGRPVGGRERTGPVLWIIGIVVAVAAVAIALIALILAAILFPVFARAREKARQVSCLSNQRQICLAMQMYAADYADHFPLADNWVPGLEMYLMNPQLHHCPSAVQAGKAPCYGFNSKLAGREVTRIQSPQDIVLLFESSDYGSSPSDPGRSLVRPGRHNGGNNFGFADGHVVWRQDGQSLTF